MQPTTLFAYFAFVCLTAENSYLGCLGTFLLSGCVSILIASHPLLLSHEQKGYETLISIFGGPAT